MNSHRSKALWFWLRNLRNPLKAVASPPIGIRQDTQQMDGVISCRECAYKTSCDKTDGLASKQMNGCIHNGLT